jgi:hypothetical protein
MVALGSDAAAELLKLKQHRCCSCRAYAFTRCHRSPTAPPQAPAGFDESPRLKSRQCPTYPEADSEQDSRGPRERRPVSRDRHADEHKGIPTLQALRSTSCSAVITPVTRQRYVEACPHDASSDIGPARIGTDLPSASTRCPVRVGVVSKCAWTPGSARSLWPPICSADPVDRNDRY